MRISVALAAVFAVCAGHAVAQDDLGALARDSIGVQVRPHDVAGAWMLESQGRTLCRVALRLEAAGQGLYAVDAPGDCGGVLPSGVAGWKPVTDGLALVDAKGQILVDFDNWSPGLLVSRQSSGADLQLRRGS